MFLSPFLQLLVHNTSPTGIILLQAMALWDNLIDKIFYKLGKSSGQPGLVEDIPAHGRELEGNGF